MNMTRIKNILAAAAAFGLLSAVAAPAFAQTAQVNQTIDQEQNQNGDFFGVNLQFDQDQNQANIQDNAFTNASGNVGANVTSGNGNQQANIALIDKASPTYNFSGSYSQETSGEGLVLSGVDHASVTAAAFEYASGDVNANVAAGVWNQQGNAMFVAGDDTLKGQTINMSQGDYVTGCAVCGLNTANINAHAFDHASGSVNVNVASGDINKQLNSMAISADGGNQNITMDQDELRSPVLG